MARTVSHPTAFAVPPDCSPRACRRRKDERPTAFCRQVVSDSTVSARPVALSSTAFCRPMVWNSTAFSHLAVWHSTVFSRPVAWSSTAFCRLAVWSSTVFLAWRPRTPRFLSPGGLELRLSLAARLCVRACVGPTASIPMAGQRVSRSTASVVGGLALQADRAAPADRRATTPVRDGASFEAIARILVRATRPQSAPRFSPVTAGRRSAARSLGTPACRARTTSSTSDWCASAA